MFGRLIQDRLTPLGVLACILVLIVSTSSAAADPPLDDGKIRVLLITGGHGFEEIPFFAMFEDMRDVEMTKATFPDAAELLTPELAKRCDVIVFYDMWAQGITPAQQQAFVSLLEHGIGIVALHHTLAAHQDWPEYAKIIGGKYRINDQIVAGETIPKSDYLHGQDISVDVADAEHPITRGLKGFQIHDETYSGYDTDPSAKVLLTTEHPQSDRELAWVTTYGNSRTFYLQLGHDHHAYADANYRLLVSRGIRWASGRPTEPSE